MKTRVNIFIIVYAAITVLLAVPIYAESNGASIPYGGYRKDGKCGFYGAKAAIKTEKEARKVIEEFLVGNELHIGVMDERPRFFRAQLLDRNETLRDVVIIDKITGRIRSTY